MLSHVKELCFILWTILHLKNCVSAGCEIKLPKNTKLKPIIHQYVGLQKTKINTNTDDFLRLQENQKVEAFCDINFQYPPYYSDRNKLYLRCSGNHLHITTDVTSQDRNHNGPIMLQCSFQSWKLYQSSRNFKWCSSNASSYILARPKHSQMTGLGLDYEYLAGICYEIFCPTFQSVYYTLASEKFQYTEPFLFGSFYKQIQKIENVEETFGLNRIVQNAYNNRQFKNWVYNENYDHSSIMQHSKLDDDVLPLLKFFWYQRLRLYNWNRYIKALRNHIESQNLVYDVVAGVSGALEAHMIKSCTSGYILENVVFDKDRYIPSYIWNYLQDAMNVSNNIVIIGFNSPFTDFHFEEDVIFCPDKCQEIPWLKNVALRFRNSEAGYIFCCSVDDVISSKRLNNFPGKNSLPERDALMLVNGKPTQ